MKRFLSILLAVLMLAVMLPATAMAAQPSVDWTNHDSENVYWVSGDQSGYTATLAAALTAAYKANKDDITIVCRPDSNVGEMTHGHVADSITIYGNNAYISGGECDLEVDEYRFSRATGVQAQDGDYLTKDITITAYDLQNLSVWGTRHTDHTVNIYLNNCNGKAIAGKENVQRIYISGTTGVNNITVKDCDFITANTAIYSNADGAVVIDGCSFTNGKVPVNFNHKAAGTQSITLKNSTFNGCGDANDWAAFAAPARFVNSQKNGVQNVVIENNTFTDTVGNNGDILLGDQRNGESSFDVNAEIVTKQDVTVKSGNSEKQSTFVVKANTSVKANALGEQPEVIRDNTPIIIYPPTDDTPNTTTGNPTTGANDFVGIAAAAAVVALLGSAVILRKK